MKWKIGAGIYLVIIFSSFSFNQENKLFNPTDNLSRVLHQLGEDHALHSLDYTEEQVLMGKQLVLEGRTVGPDGKRTRYVSKHYMCTTCHNTQREDPDLSVSEPETRLDYVKTKGIPFLQGTTFKGIVNRESWYNDDYVKKYGEEIVGKAHKNLRESIQLCAVECAQGRAMKAWEIDAVLAYFWTLEYNLADLDLSPEEWESINEKAIDNEAKIKLLKSKYLQKSPAHFFQSAADKKEGYPGLEGNPDIGKDIYELSCLHCHQQGGVSHYVLDSKALSFKDLAKSIPKNSHFSLYQIIAYGTYAIPGHKPYMPHFPAERMSKQQVEDLRAYIELKANE